MAETISGGYYIGEDGRPHDAFGRALDVSQETAVDVVGAMDGLRQAQAPEAVPAAVPVEATGTAKKGRRK